ncbi:MAG TPA: hypothetical protein VJI33_00825 [Candidatus Paceibacterota bacterium]
MKNKTTKKGSGTLKLAILGASLAAAAAGAYFFFGPKGKKHRATTRAWAIKMKGDIVEKLERAKDVSEPIYNKIIDSVASEYKKGKKASQEEIVALAQDLKKHWKVIRGGAQTFKHDALKSAKKIARP